LEEEGCGERKHARKKGRSKGEGEGDGEKSAGDERANFVRVKTCKIVIIIIF
jgi:hypothetical protein